MAKLDIDIDIDWDDYLYECAAWEKQKMIDSLWQDGYTPQGVSEDEFDMIAESTSEKFLKECLENIWKNRMFINNEDLESLKYYTNKGDYGN